MTNWIIQGIGFVAFILLLLVFQTNKRRNMLYLKIAASALYALHFGLLGAWTGSAMNVIGVGRNYVFQQRTEKRWADKRYWLYLFIAIFAISGFFTWEGYHSLLPILGMTAGSIGFWMKNPKNTRLLILIASPAWLIYNLIVGSYPGIITEIFLITSVLVGILRFDIVKRWLRK